MNDNYVGLTIRKEVLARNNLTIDLDTLKEVAAKTMQSFWELNDKGPCPEVNIRKVYPDTLEIEDYRVNPECELQIRLSLEQENYAPFNSWMEAESPNSKQWGMIVELGAYVSKQFPQLIFSATSSFFCYPGRAEGEKYTLLFQNGEIVEKLTRQEWVEKYLGTRFPKGYQREEANP